MALTILEQIDFIDTGTNSVGTDFSRILKQVAIEYGHDFLTTMKTVDATTEKEAKDYTNKMTQFIRRCLQEESNAVKLLLRVMFVVVGQSATDFATVDSATPLQAATFFTNNIRKAMEVGAVIEKEEVDAYDGVV